MTPTRFLPLAILVSILMLSRASAQEQLYNPAADTDAELRAATAAALESGRHVLLQVGGNWCRWCIKLDALMSSDAQVDSMLAADFVLLRVNYSPENRNERLLESLGNPQRFGFPVLLVLDGSGEVLHVQDSALLESGDGHDPEKVLRFLAMWTPAAVAWAPPMKQSSSAAEE